MPATGTDRVPSDVLMAPAGSINTAQARAPRRLLALAPRGGDMRGRARELLAFERLRETGDPVLRERLVERYLGLAGGLALRYANPRRQSEEDVLQVARMGLVKAVDRFDPGRGLAFATYAVPTILGEIKRYFRDTAWATHVPRGLQDTSLAIVRASRKLAMRDGRPPTAAALAAELDIGEEEVVDALQANEDAVSLDIQVKRDDGNRDETLLETVGTSEPGYQLALDRWAIQNAVRGLSDRDRLILKLRFEDDLTQQQVGERVGLSQMQVSRLLRRSLQRVRDTIDGQGAPDRRDQCGRAG
jgi:RNA polymerase sigma-B factor